MTAQPNPQDDLTARMRVSARSAESAIRAARREAELFISACHLQARRSAQMLHPSQATPASKAPEPLAQPATTQPRLGILGIPLLPGEDPLENPYAGKPL